LGNGFCLCLSEGGHGECWRGGKEIASVSEIEGSPEAWLIPWFVVVFSTVAAAKIMSGHNEGEVRR
jgi:hypothetical protein